MVTVSVQPYADNNDIYLQLYFTSGARARSRLAPLNVDNVHSLQRRAHRRSPMAMIRQAIKRRPTAAAGLGLT